MFKLSIEACLGVSLADKGKNDFPCKGIREYVIYREFQLLGTFVDVIGDEAGIKSRNAVSYAILRDRSNIS